MTGSCPPGVQEESATHPPLPPGTCASGLPKSGPVFPRPVLLPGLGGVEHTSETVGQGRRSRKPSTSRNRRSMLTTCRANRWGSAPPHPSPDPHRADAFYGALDVGDVEARSRHALGLRDSPAGTWHSSRRHRFRLRQGAVLAPRRGALEGPAVVADRIETGPPLPEPQEGRPSEVRECVCGPPVFLGDGSPGPRRPQRGPFWGSEARGPAPAGRHRGAPGSFWPNARGKSRNPWICRGETGGALTM